MLSRNYDKSVNGSITVIFNYFSMIFDYVSLSWYIDLFELTNGNHVRLSNDLVDMWKTKNEL